MVHPAPDLPVQEASALQDLQMLGHRIERHFHWCRQFADGGRSGAQSPHQKATSGIAESSENTVQVRCILFNHMVEYKPKDLDPQPEFEIVQPRFNKKQFIGIGRFTDKKAPYYTILAFSKILKNHADAKLLLAGKGELLNSCRNLVRYLRLENNVEFLGVISPDEFRNYLSESLAFVQHSITAEDGDMEGTPVSILEASVAGLPVISTYHAGIPDVIDHNKTGLLCNEHDVETMAKYMLRILDDVDFAKTLGSNGKKLITSQYNLKRHIKELQRILEKP